MRNKQLVSRNMLILKIRTIRIDRPWKILMLSRTRLVLTKSVAYLLSLMDMVADK